MSWSFVRFHEFKFQTEPESFSFLSWKVLFLKKYFFGRTAKIHPKDGISRLNFLEGFALSQYFLNIDPWYFGIKNIMIWFYARYFFWRSSLLNFLFVFSSLQLEATMSNQFINIFSVFHYSTIISTKNKPIYRIFCQMFQGLLFIQGERYSGL